MFKRPKVREPKSVLPPLDLAVPTKIDTSETRGAAQTDLLAGIGSATEANLTLGKILREAFRLVDEMASFSCQFEAEAETTRARADQFVGLVMALQSQSSDIHARLDGAAQTLVGAHVRSKSALTSVEDLTTSINDIERIIKMIASVASQTNLLALNATIEAARAGGAGAGFRVVAEEVKALSAQIQHATGAIVASVDRVRKRAAHNTMEVKGFDATIQALESVFSLVRDLLTQQADKIHDIGFGTQDLADSAQGVRIHAGRMRDLGATARHMTTRADGAVGSVRDAFGTLVDRAAVVLSHGDDRECQRRWPIMCTGRVTFQRQTFPVRVIDLSRQALQIETRADFPSDGLGETVGLDVDEIGVLNVRLLTATATGYEALIVDAKPALLERIVATTERLRTSYQPYIDRVQKMSATIAGAIETALDAKILSIFELFDTNYRRDGTTEPAQYMNDAVAALTPCVQPILEAALLETPRPDFCLLQDRNGFAVVHNLRYSMPARAGDVVWNMRHARTRRLFNDRVGLAASRNLSPFFVQSYARDMGDAVEMRMEFDAPVSIKARHWGAVRLAYKLP